VKRLCTFSTASISQYLSSSGATKLHCYIRPMRHGPTDSYHGKIKTA